MITVRKEIHPRTGEVGYREILPDQYSHLQEFVRVFEFQGNGDVHYRPALAWDVDGNWARSYYLQKQEFEIINE